MSVSAGSGSPWGRILAHKGAMVSPVQIPLPLLDSVRISGLFPRVAKALEKS